MKLVRLVYYSHASREMSLSDLKSILDTARRDDPRHDEITIISYEEITAPIFKQWKMGYAGGSAEFTKLLKEMGQTEFLPETMSPRQAFQFLQHLAGNQDNL